jgi:hypothetical protein
MTLGRALTDLMTARKKLEWQLKQVENAISALSGMRGRAGRPKTARRLSAVARRRIALAQKRRWAAWRKAERR